MTDRELMEAAAKAAGIFLTPETLAEVFPKWEWDDDYEPRHLDGGGMPGTVVVYSYSGELSGTTREEWHPLTDDGDALRLAVKLDMDIFIRCGGETEVVAPLGKPQTVEHGSDPYAATRRAIVRAAAAIGKEMP